MKLTAISALLAAAFALGCGDQPIKTGPTPLAQSPSSLAVQAATSKTQTAVSKTLYNITFTGDITSGPLGPIALNTTNPWGSVRLDSATLTLPVAVDLSGTACGRPDPTNWGGNAGTWTAPLVVKKGSNGNFTHLGFQGPVVVGSTSYILNLAVNSNATSSTSGGAFILQFTNALAQLGASSPDPAADPCVTFVITATPR